ncbi:MAG: hypothetical protein K2W85_09960 [Phycisphaerales bacterium]|nr:hypothetical protein [Phycisphaerales bacterium]
MPHTTSTALSKIPALTFLFWVMKIAATTLGETAGDLFSMTMGIGYMWSTLILMAGFAAVLIGQLAAKRYIPFLYWAVILATSTAGTTMSDFMNRTSAHGDGPGLGIGYATGSAILVSLLVGVLIVWRLVEKSLSVTDVRSRRAEVFYWSAILVSNTLGTSLGDYLADDSGLGFAGGAALIGGVIALIVAIYLLAKRMKVASPALYVGLFWAAFVLTRPFGATMGDVLTKNADKGGLGFGTIGSSAVLAVILVAVILYTMRRDARATAAAASAGKPVPEPS